MLAQAKRVFMTVINLCTWFLHKLGPFIVVPSLQSLLYDQKDLLILLIFGIAERSFD